MKKEEQNIVRTGWRIESLEDVLKLKDYSIVGSVLSNFENSICLNVMIKIGEENQQPVIAQYFILQSENGEYGYGVNMESYEYLNRSDLAYNSIRLYETEEFHLKEDFNRFYMELGKTGYSCRGLGILREFDKERVKQLAFFCLKNHYQPELVSVFSVVKSVSEMEKNPDELQLDISQISISPESSKLVANACQNIQSFQRDIQVPVYHPTDKAPQKEVYFGYVYDKNGIAGGVHGPLRILEGKEAVANFVCDEQLLGNDKLITDTFENEILTTHGMFVHTLGQTVSNSMIKEIMLCIQKKQQDLFRPEEELERE